MTPRVTTINWTSNGQFPQTIVNPMSQSITFGFDPNSGMKTSQTDPNYTTANPLKTTWKYDDFARKTQENRLDGTYTVWTYNDCATWGGCIIGSHALALTYSVNNVGGSVQNNGTTYYDQLDRPLMANPLNLAGGRDRYEVRYDNLGRVARKAMPCTWTSDTAACPYWTTNYYDGLNRLTQSQRPISATNSNLQTTTIRYAGRTTIVIDPLSVNDGGTKKIHFVTGALAQSYDPYHYGQVFVYDAFGSLLSVTDTASNALFTATYDYGIQAFQRNATDMDLDVSTAAGQHRQYTYDALGELTSWSDANGNSFSALYDLLSRPTQRNDPDYTTYWTWGNSASSYNIGQLQSISGLDNSGSFNETYTFDSKTRLWMDTLNIPQGGGIHTYTTTYNATTGLPDTLQYPTAGTYQLKLQYAYTNGLLQSISDFNAPSTVFWKANAANPRGQVTQETLGNGVVMNRSYDAVTGWISSLQAGVGGGAGLVNSSFGFDEVGNLTQRQNNNLGLTENFYYDDDYRLDHSTLNGTVNLQLGYDPAGTGNIAYRSDVAASQNWTYDPVKKHAFIQAGACCLASASYDNNGNAIKRDGNTFYWSSYNQPIFVAKFNEQSQLYYGPYRKRYLASYSSNNDIYPAENTYYVGNRLEIAAGPGTPGGDYRHYIYAGNEPVAILSVSSGVNTLRYVIPDHQGSLSSIVSDSSPGPVANYVSESFTPYGLRRSGETWSGPPTSGDETLINGVSRQGYTGHSADGVSMGLNYMNGRLQDALTGVFLSPDPYVPNPGNTQSFNRYSYVNNNPLSFTDPSGFDETGLPELIVTAGGGPENPYTDVLAGAVEILSDFGLGSLFGGGGPSLTPNQQLAEHHGINLSTQLPTIQVTASAGSFSSTSVAGIASQLYSPFTVSAIAGTMGVDPDMVHEQVTTSPSQSANELDTINVYANASQGFNWMNLIPGWSALVCGYYGCGAGNWTMAGIGAIPFGSLESAGARGASSLVGRSFGRLGTIVDNPGVQLSGFAGSSTPGHAINQIISRGVTPSALQAALSNPAVVLQQAGGRFLYLTEQTAVAITDAGQVVTAWGQQYFGPGVLEVLSEVGAVP